MALIWITTKQAAELEQVSDRTMRRNKEKYIYRPINGAEYEFALCSLSKSAQARYRGEQDQLNEDVLLSLTDAQREVVFTKLSAVEGYQSFKETYSKKDKQRAFLAQYNEQHPDNPITKNQLNHWEVLYFCDGISGLVDRRGTWNKGVSSIPEVAKQMFLAYWLQEKGTNRGGPSVASCYRLTQQQLPELQLPSVSTFERMVRNLPAPLKILMRESRKAYVLDSSWSVINKDADKLVINSENSVSITMQEGEIGGTLKNVLTTVPAAQDFAISVKVSGGLTDDFQSAALAIMTDTNNVVAAMRRHHSFFENQCFAMIAGGVEKPYQVDTQKDQEAYLKLVKDGAMFTSCYSYDGVNWTEIRSQEYNRLKDVAAEDLRIGVYASTGNSNKYKPVTFTDFTYYPADGGKEMVIPFAKSNKPVVPDEGTLSVKYNSGVKLTVNGEAQKLADLIGKYEEKKVEAGTPYTLVFAPRAEGREFSSITINGVEQEIKDTAAFTYEFTTDGEAQELNFAFAQIDKRILRDLIVYAEDYAANNDMESLVPVVKKKFEAALADAITVRDTVAVTQEQINDSWSDLLDAIHLLNFEKGNKAKLTELVGYANSIVTENFTPNSVAIFEAALTAAQEVLDDENALQADIDNAYETLHEAALALVNAASVEALQNLVDEAGDIDLGEYIDLKNDDFKKYREALEQANKVLADKNATQKQVDSAAEALVKAMSDLRKTPNKDALRDLVVEVEALDLSAYTPESAANVRDVLASARDLLNNDLATQEETDEMEAALNEAYRSLETKKNNTPSGGSSSSSHTNKPSGNTYGTEGAVPAAVVQTAQEVKVEASVRSDTTPPFTLKRGQAYCFKMTVLNGSTAAPNFTVGDGSVLKTQFVAKVGNDDYYRVWAIGMPGKSTGVYTQMPQEMPQRHCIVTIA